MFSYFSFVFFHSLKELYFLECDVGQSEFTPPGLISLNRVCEPLLGIIKKVMSMASLMANILPGLVWSTPDQVSRFEPRPGTLCCVLGQVTYLSLTVLLFTQEYNWVVVNCWVNLINQGRI